MKAEKNMKIAELIDIDGESLEDACEVHGIDADKMLARINEYLADK